MAENWLLRLITRNNLNELEERTVRALNTYSIARKTLVDSILSDKALKRITSNYQRNKLEKETATMKEVSNKCLQLLLYLESERNSKFSKRGGNHAKDRKVINKR